MKGFHLMPRLKTKAKSYVIQISAMEHQNERDAKPTDVVFHACFRK